MTIDAAVMVAEAPEAEVVTKAAGASEVVVLPTLVVETITAGVGMPEAVNEPTALVCPG